MPAENSYFCEPHWPALSGTVLPGGYEVGEIVEAEAQRARFRVRVLGDWSANAFADVFCASGAEAEEQVSLWMAAKELQNSNLNSPLAAGQFEHQEAQLIYVVAPGADENLAGALGERPVTAEEAREILSNLRGSLEYLHGHGWVHGHLSPEQVLAVRDSIRISAEYAGKINAARPMKLLAAKYVAPEASGGNITPAADVWCLGATLFEALTQKIFSADRLPEASTLPQPFNRIVERCVAPDPQMRCALVEVRDLAANRPVAPPTKEQPVAPVAPVTQEAAPLLTRVVRPEKPVETKSKLWIYAAVAGLFVVLLLWAARPRHQYVPATAHIPATSTAPPAAVPVPKINTWETKTFTPGKNLPAAQRNPPSSPRVEKSAAQDPPSANGTVWRVVVFTYAHEPDAENKVQLVNHRHPNLNAAVFNPSGHTNLYLVTVGGRMTREQAARLRHRVIGLGLPRDSYIQNYKQ